MNKSNKAMLMALMMIATAAMALAPGAQAKAVDVDVQNQCVSGDWVHICATLVRDTRSVVKPDTSHLQTACTDPLGLGDVCVYTIPSIIDAATARSNVNIYEVDEQHQVYGDAIVYFACEVVFGDPNYCRYIIAAETAGFADLDGNGLLDAVVIDDLAIPLQA